MKTISALGCYGTTAVTALTAQNTTGVDAVFPASSEFVEKQVNNMNYSQGIVPGIHVLQ